MSELDQVLRSHRESIRMRSRSAGFEMVEMYRGVWQAISGDLDSLLGEIRERKAAGLPVSPSWLYRAQRYRTLMAQVDQQIRRFDSYITKQTFRETRWGLDQGSSDARAAVLAALGTGPRGATAPWHHVSTGAVEELAGISAREAPLGKLIESFAGSAARSVRQTLVTGLATGQDPRTIAARVRKVCGLPLTRSMRIVRTEMMRAYREASRIQYQKNPQVVEGWVWRSALTSRTCVMCWAMHGTVHKFTERLDDHPNGRCIPGPRVKSWADILGDPSIPDERPPIVTGIDEFAKAGEDVQRKVLGQRAFEAYKAGRVQIDEFVGQSTDPVWGSMRFAKSTTEVLSKALDVETEMYAPLVRRFIDENIANDAVKFKMAREEIARLGLNEKQSARLMELLGLEDYSLPTIPQAPVTFDRLRSKISKEFLETEEELDRIDKELKELLAAEPSGEVSRRTQELEGRRGRLYWRRETENGRLREALVDELNSRGTRNLSVDIVCGPEAPEWAHEDSKPARTFLQSFCRALPTTVDEDALQTSVRSISRSRAYYDVAARTIQVPQTRNFMELEGQVLVHEYGHHLEAIIPEGTKRAVEYLKYRGAGEPEAPLFATRPNEIGWRDKFVSPYMGRSYNGRATEIVSVTLEKLYGDPIDILRRDPESVSFVLALLGWE